MKISKLSVPILAAIFFCCISMSSAQENSNGKPLVAPDYYKSSVDFSGKGNTSPNTNVQLSAPRVISAQEQELMNQMREAKLSGDQSRHMDLDKQRDAVSGVTLTKTCTLNGGFFTQTTGKPPFANPEYVTTEIAPAGSKKGFATATEQVGANIGRIWLLVCRDTAAGIAAQCNYYYSDNGGSSWIGYVTLTLGTPFHFNSDQVDIEIVEGATGDKYLWAVFGINNAGANQVVEIANVDITTFAGVASVLSWPGNNAAYRYYRPRISSDNPSYAPASTYVFVICSQDSTAGTYNENSQRYAEIHLATNTTTITPIYQGPLYGWYEGSGPGGLAYHRDLHSDIAYYRNNTTGDSLIVTFSNVPDSTRIFLCSSAEATYTNNPATRVGLATNYHQQYTKIYSTGQPNGQNLMIATRRNFQNNGDWDVYYYKSANGSIAPASWGQGYIDSYTSTTTVPAAIDLIGKRGTVDFRVAYTYDNTSFDSAMYSVYNGTTWQTNPTRVSNFDTGPFNCPPKPGFRTGGGDDCFTVWSQYDGNNAWSSRQCAGTVGIINNHEVVPHAYSLDQNYPNPFNPTTNIKFGLPKSGLVKLVIYDILGNEVKTVLNEYRDAGSYTVDFDASSLSSGVYFYKITSGDFASTKKMMLIK